MFLTNSEFAAAFKKIAILKLPKHTFHEFRKSWSLENLHKKLKTLLPVQERLSPSSGIHFASNDHKFECHSSSDTNESVYAKWWIHQRQIEKLLQCLSFSYFSIPLITLLFQCFKALLLHWCRSHIFKYNAIHFRCSGFKRTNLSRIRGNMKPAYAWVNRKGSETINLLSATALVIKETAGFFEPTHSH